MVFDSSLEHQHSTIKKIVRRWFGPYVVVKAYENDTYKLPELDGTNLKILIAEKRIKTFKKRDGRFILDSLQEFHRIHESQEEAADLNIQEDEDKDESS